MILQICANFKKLKLFLMSKMGFKFLKKFKILFMQSCLNYLRKLQSNKKKIIIIRITIQKGD